MFMLTSPPTLILDPLERDLMQRLWDSGPQTTRQLLTLLRRERAMAYLTMTEALERLCAHGMLDRHRVPCPLTQSTWQYKPALTRQTIEQLCGTLGVSGGGNN